MGAMPRPLCLVIVNPAAGGGRTERLWRDLRDDLRRLGLVFEWAPTTGPGSATDLARAAADRGLGLVVAVGGDGTLNEVVNGAVADDRPRPSVGAILTGRGRDAARNFGLAADPRAAARRLVEGAGVSVDPPRAEWPGGARRGGRARRPARPPPAPRGGEVRARHAGHLHGPPRSPALAALTARGRGPILPPGGIARAQRGHARQGARPAAPYRGPGAGPAADDRQRRVLRGHPPADLRRAGRARAGAEAPARPPHRVVRDRGDPLRIQVRAPAEDRGAAGRVRPLRGQVMAERQTLPVRGMHCAACVGKVERALTGVPGVERAAVNLATERAAITFDPARTSV